MKIVIYTPPRRGEDGVALAEHFAWNIRKQFKSQVPDLQVTVAAGSNDSHILSVRVTDAGTTDVTAIKSKLEKQAKVFCCIDQLTLMMHDIDAKRKIVAEILKENAENHDGIKFADSFFLHTMEAAYTVSVSALSKLYECGKHQQKTVNFVWLLTFIKNNLPNLYQRVQALTPTNIDDYLTLLRQWEGAGGLARKLAKHRNELLAHNGQKYFPDPTRFPRIHRLSDGDLNQLQAKAGEIVQRCWLAFTGGSHDLESTVDGDVQRLFQRLREHRRAAGLAMTIRSIPTPSDTTRLPTAN